MFGPLLGVQMSFRVAGARDCGPCQKSAQHWGFVAFPNTMAGVGHLKRTCKDAFRVAGAVQKTCSSEMLGGEGEGLHFGASDLQVCWFCVTGATFRMTWHHFFVAGAKLYLDTWNGKIENWGSLAELFCFWCCQVQKVRKSRRIAAFFDVVKFKNWGRLAA